MRNYYEAELRSLREAAQEFAEAYPEQARQLNINSLREWDPYVERLLEGTAFLTALLQQRIDDDVPEICEALLMQLCPQSLKPFPAATIIELQPLLRQLNHTFNLPKASRFKFYSSEGGQKIPLEFRTTQAIAVQPLIISACNTEALATGGTALKITLQNQAKVALAELDWRHLSFYIHAESSIADTIYYLLLGGMVTVKLRLPEFPNRLIEWSGDNANVVCRAFSPERSLLPMDNKQVYALQLLQEYFAFREKFYFIELQGIEKIVFPNEATSIEIIMNSSIELPKEITVTKSMLRLNCVPAVNLFSMTSEPIQLTHQRVEYPIILDAVQPENTIFYELQKVEGINVENGERTEYSAMQSFAFQPQLENFYNLTFKQLRSKQPRPYLMLGGKQVLNREDLSCLLLACNSQLPRRYLQEGMSVENTAEIPSFLKSKILLRPSAMLLPPERQHYRWQLLSYLAMHLQAISDANSLQALLKLWDWSNRPEQQRQIEAIKKLTLVPMQQLQRGCLVSVLSFEIVLQDENFLSNATCYKFASLLHHFFCYFAPLNQAVTTKVILQTQNKEWIWQPLLI